MYAEKTCIRFVLYTIISAFLCAFTALSNNVLVTIKSNGTVCYKQSVQLTCHAYGINVTQYKWTSTTFEQAKETASIMVVATHDPVEYKCTVTGTNGESGYSSVTVSSNGEFTCYISAVCNVDCMG